MKVAILVLCVLFSCKVGHSAEALPAMEDFILYDMRVDRFSPDRKLTGATAKLSHIKDLGVNAIILLPIAKFFAPNAQPTVNRFEVSYGVEEPDRLDSRFGTPDDLIKFVSEAHKLGIAVLVDVVPHGVWETSTLVKTHPNWFLPNVLVDGTWKVKRRDGSLGVRWGQMNDFDFTQTEVQNWWIDTMVNSWVKKYNIDGFRCDLEPAYAGGQIWSAIRARVLKETGKRLTIISEGYADASVINGTATIPGFDFTEHDFGLNSAIELQDFFQPYNNLVDIIKKGNVEIAKKYPDWSQGTWTKNFDRSERMYSAFTSNNNSLHYLVKGLLVRVAYGVLLGPVVPRFFMGDEFNNPETMPENYPLYFNEFDWKTLNQPANQAFLKKVKKIISIRKNHRKIIAPFEPRLKDTNIFKVGSDFDLPAYALVKDGVSIVVAGAQYKSANTSLQIPINEMGLSSDRYTVEDLINGTTLTVTRSQLQTFPMTLVAGDVAVLKISSQSGNSGGSWIFCANENQTCRFDGEKTVRYGANDKYFYKKAKSTIECNNQEFGDPAFGVIKNCHYQNVNPAPTPLPVSNWQRAESNDVLWTVQNAIDGSFSTVYSSNNYKTQPKNGLYLAAWLNSYSLVSSIQLTARMSQTKPLAFPQEYDIYLTDDRDSQWIFVGRYRLQPNTQGQVIVNLDQSHKTRGIMIKPTILGKDDFGGLYFQLAEIQLK